ncbi:MAG: PAS domain S-box protein [Desulfitobacterium hafniense]|nr:PAS domain S-box protein [Desulfitobacterium hafniense]
MNTMQFVVILASVILLICLLSYFLMSSQLRRYKQAEKEVKSINGLLEQKVKEQSEELESLNDLLESEYMENLKLSEQRYKNIINHLGLGLTVISPELKVLTVNPKIEEWYPDVDFSSQPLCYQAFHTGSKQACDNECPVIKAFEDGSIHEKILEYEANSKLESIRIIASPIKDKTGNVIAVSELVEDISTSRYSERQINSLNEKLRNFINEQTIQLIQAENLYHLLLKNSSDGIMVFDPLNGLIRETNYQMQSMIGYSEDELLLLKISDLFLIENGSCINDLIKNLVQEEETVYYPCVYKRKDGKFLDVEISVSRVELNQTEMCLLNVRDVSERISTEKALHDSYENLKLTLRETVNALVAIGEKRDPYTAGHQYRVAELACAIAKEMGLPDNEIEEIGIAGKLHDIGKIHVPSDILNKPGRLSDMEMGIIKGHPEIGYEVLNRIPFEIPVAEIVRQHHERLDGTGYPRGLKGNGILLQAKILAVADTVEAMASHRPYRPAVGLDFALEELVKNKGRLYDSKVVETCIDLFESKKFCFASLEIKTA